MSDELLMHISSNSNPTDPALPTKLAKLEARMAGKGSLGPPPKLMLSEELHDSPYSSDSDGDIGGEYLIQANFQKRRKVCEDEEEEEAAAAAATFSQQSEEIRVADRGALPGLFDGLMHFFQRVLFRVLSYGPMPKHVAFIMDGNRRFSKRQNLEQGGGHRIGYSALISALRYCYEMGVNYVTVYAFSIDNFKRKPLEVEDVMNLMLEKLEEMLSKESIVSTYNVKVNFWGNLKLLKDPVRVAAENVMEKTARNTGPVLSICVAYTSTDEIMNAVSKSCREKSEQRALNGYSCDDGEVISVDDIEKHLYTDGCPYPDIVVRTSGETRLSNFLLWQTTFCHLQNPSCLWPQFSLRHLIWAILDYQRVYPYLEKRKKDD